MKRNKVSFIILGILLISMSLAHGQTPLGTSFTYQGQLDQGNNPASGNYDFEFRLFDAEENGLQVGAVVTVDDESVQSGVFTVELDFGAGIFTGDRMWLQVSVREGTGTGSYTLLSPRQEVTATPYALRSKDSETALFAADSGTLDGNDSTDFLLTTGGTITGDLQVNGTLTAELSAVTQPVIYTPAFVTCGTNAESNFLQWSFVVSGRFQLTVDGVVYDVDANLISVGDMADVALAIESAIRTATGGQETVIWSLDHFVVASGNTSASSSISVLEAHSSGLGTDISGAGSEDWMDCDSGNGVASERVLDKSVYDGQIVALNEFGEFDSRWIPAQIGYNHNAGIVAYQLNPGTFQSGSNAEIVVSGAIVSFRQASFGDPWYAAGRLMGTLDNPLGLIWSDVEQLNIEFAARIGTGAENQSFGFLSGYTPDIGFASRRIAFVWDVSTSKMYTITGDAVEVTSIEIPGFSSVDAATPHLYAIDVTPARVKFYIDNVLVSTHTTSIPNGSSAVTVGASGSSDDDSLVQMSTVTIRHNS